MAVGRVLRIKVLIDIRKPLMRGITAKVESMEKKWCSFPYEFLPDFCYTCGHIGHIDTQCSIQLEKGETPQFSRSLCFIPEKRRGEGHEERSFFWCKIAGSMAQWNLGSRGSFGGRGDRWGSSGSDNDGRTWKKGRDDKTLEKGEETTSPTKTPPMPPRNKSPAKKVLLLQTNDPNFAAAIDGGVLRMI